jgi:hypothetical protein
MRASPSLVPGIERDVYLILDDFGRMGSASRSGVVRSEPPLANWPLWYFLGMRGLTILFVTSRSALGDAGAAAASLRVATYRPHAGVNVP